MNKEYLIYKLSDEVKNSCKIDKDAFKKFNVKRGLRNEDGSEDSFEVEHTYNDTQIAWFKAGSALNFAAKNK